MERVGIFFADDGLCLFKSLALVPLAFCKKTFQERVCIPLADDVDRIFPSLGVFVA